MTVPTQEQFAEWLSIANAPFEFRTPQPERTIVDKEFLVSIYVERIALIGARDAQLMSTAIGVWLNQTREIAKAHQRVLRSERKDPIRKLFQPIRGTPEERVQRLFEIDLDHPDEPSVIRRVKTRIERWKTPPWTNSWVGDLVKAFAEYFDVNAPQRMIDAYRQMAPAADVARKAIDDLIQAEQALSAIQLPYYRAPHRLHHLARLAASEDCWNFKLSAFPLKRKDARNSERLFVFRMHDSHMRHFRRPLVETIDELMGIDGFRHQYDRRTIERLCTEFTGSLCAEFTGR